ncbi:MAG: methylenetetrahydrofolate--tRNA-(uracil(54)-C(5))-methyltransferase (FADH(2)-oxidizing) TrmFO [Anaerolineaceae bacterium]|jgi:methylenetetrahydrofolate--tRNA-(uracil-5-)-methyltransferase|nr:MAG: methylenetetrahydrofolate--tRNA-(uracil(54)-C(5))-methyltransferase (FADH(2)-oxidizing) TrmFO [Anaerolineaceae bacterium]
MQSELVVVGGGLAGCEAAWQAAHRGISVLLYEMRPLKMTEAHKTALLGELVCSNSLGSTLTTNGTGLLFNEMKILNSIVCRVAEETSVPAGSALAVDRTQFAERLTGLIASHPFIKIIHQEVTKIPQETSIIASGPLTSQPLIEALQRFHGERNLFFYDAIAPIIEAESIDMQATFRGSRYGKGKFGEGDYLNCPLDKERYEYFIEQLINAQQIELKPFEQEINQGVNAGPGNFFEGCLPIEILARRGINALAYGPLRPVGLRKAYKGNPPFAVVQLRQDNTSKTTYNMVGFQTNLTFSEQKRIFRMIPGLHDAEFVRFGQMHRNTFLFAPTLINQNLQAINRPGLFFAGQIIGVEGYLGNAATGLVAGINAARLLKEKPLITFPRETMIGSLCFYVSNAEKDTFQPMKANFGLLPPITPRIKNKGDRKIAYSNRALKMINNLYNSEP